MTRFFVDYPKLGMQEVQTHPAARRLEPEKIVLHYYVFSFDLRSGLAWY